MLVVCTESTYECIFYSTHRDNCWIQNKFKITMLYSINEHTQPALYAICNYIIVVLKHHITYLKIHHYLHITIDNDKNGTKLNCVQLVEGFSNYFKWQWHFWPLEGLRPLWGGNPLTAGWKLALGFFRILMSSDKEDDDDVLAFKKYGHLARIGVKE